MKYEAEWQHSNNEIKLAKKWSGNCFSNSFHPIAAYQHEVSIAVDAFYVRCKVSASLSVHTTCNNKIIYR